VQDIVLRQAWGFGRGLHMRMCPAAGDYVFAKCWTYVMAVKEQLGALTHGKNFTKPARWPWVAHRN